jgi:hypothetical protein
VAPPRRFRRLEFDSRVQLVQRRDESRLVEHLLVVAELVAPIVVFG